MEKNKIEIVGKVIFHRSEEGCKCCKGKHIYSQYVKFDSKIKVHPAFEGDYLRGVLHNFITDKENKRIKITMEECKDE